MKEASKRLSLRVKNSKLGRRVGAGAAAITALASLWIAASAQVPGSGGSRLGYDLGSNRLPRQDAEFDLARVQFSSGPGRMMYGGGGWSHDYPDAEEHILQIAGEATGIRLHRLSYVVVRLDSEEIFKYPFLYFSEPGEMNMTEKEVGLLREYLNRGGFAMIDDFYGRRELDWFLFQMKRVFPDREFVELNIGHPIFHSYYDIPTLEDTGLGKPRRSPGPARYYGYYDDHGRLLMIINHDNDLGDFWEWIDQPRYPLEPSTTALRIGINYFIYAMTH
jgi:hypothetical protein